MRPARTIFCQILQQLLKAFDRRRFHDFGWQHVVYADQTQYLSFHYSYLLAVDVFMQPESMTLESQGPSVLQILAIKPLLEMRRALAKHRSVDKA